MAKKWSKKEINEYLSTKQISQENYVAPTVQTNYQPSIESTVNAFNSVQPTVSQPTINNTQTTVEQPKIQDNTTQQEEQKSFGFSIDNKKTTKEDAKKERDTAYDKLMEYKKKKGINLFNEKKYKNDEVYQQLLKDSQNKQKAYDEARVQKNTEKTQKELEKANPVASAIARTGIAFGSGATRGFEGIESSVRKITGQEQETDKFNFNEPMLNAAQQGANKGEQVAMNIAQSWGQMTPQMMVPGAKAATALGFLNYGGSAYNDAKRDGATEEQATMYGIASGSTEMLMEKVLGGFENVYGKKMGKDFTSNVMSKFIKNKAVRDTLSGMKGEFTEEYLQEFLEPILKNIILKEDNGADFWNTMKDDLGAGLKQLGSQLFNQQNLVAGLYGAASSGLLQGPMNFANQQMQQTQQQKPLEQVIRENIAQEEQQNVPQIEEQPQIPTQTPLNEVNQGVLQQNNQILGQEQTPQITPLNQVNQELQETRQQDVADSVRAMNLETEPQFTQKQGNYVYEKSDNSKIDNLRKDAATYLKEGEQTTNFVNILEKLVKDKDIEIRLDTKLGNKVNGTYKNGVITINPNSNRAGEFVAIHELTHAIGTKPMIDMIQTYRKSNAEFNNAVERLLSTYNTTEINEEALGDIAGQLFGNQEYINNLSMENPSLFKKIYNEIKYLWHQFTGYKNQNQFIEDLRNKWESAYRNSKAKQTNKTGYSINEDNDLSYQSSQYHKAYGKGITVDQFMNKNIKLYDNMKNSTEAIEQLNNAKDNPDAEITIYRATPSNSINTGDWVFLDKEHAERLTKSLFSDIPIPGYKVVEEKVKAKDVDWTGKNLEFVYSPDGVRSVKTENKTIFKDNTGRELSKQQQEYFKDSKAVDDKGELEVVYHGSKKAGFTTFETPDNVSFFTDNEGVANTYSGSNEKVDTRKLESLFDAKTWLKGINEDLYIENNKVYDYDGEEILSFDNQEDLLKNLKRAIQIELGNTEAGGVYEGYVNITKPYTIDVEGQNWNNITIGENKEIKNMYDSLSEKEKDSLSTLADKMDSMYDNYKDSVEGFYQRLNATNEKLYDKVTNDNSIREKLYKAALYQWEDSSVEDLIGKRYSTNDIVKQVLEKNKNGSNYDGVIFKNIIDEGMYEGGTDGSTSTVYVTLNPNQFKATDNLNPTEDPDIRYSKDNQTWREYLEKEFPSQGTRTDLDEVTGRNKPKQENKTIQEEKPQEMPKNEVKQEIKKEQKSFLTTNEQQELDNLRDWKENGAWDLSKEEQTRLDELERKSQGITKKFPDLKKTVTQEDTKPIYFKYKDNQISKENNKVLKQAESVVPANNQGRRTKEQWLKVAEYIGSNADVKTSSQLQQLAMETWLETRPNTKSNLNRQGSKYVDFKTNEWFNAMYKGAGVGTDVKMSLEEATDSKGKKVDLMPTSDNTYEKVNVKSKQNEIISKEDIKNEVLKIGDEKVSNFYSNATEKSKFITEENRVKLMDNDNLKYYDAINNKDTLQNALDKLDTDAEQQVGDFFAKKDFTAEDVATGWILVKRYQDAGNFEAMSNVLERMREQGTKAGQTIQMYGMLQRLTPEGMEYYAQKQLDNAYNKFVENKSKKQIDKYAKDFTLTAEEHQFIKDTMEKVQNMTDEDAKKVEIGKIVRMLSDKLPPEKGQRIKAWMRISMLGNPKTQVRNVVGNAIIQPVNWVGDIFATKADQIMSKRTGVRTKGNTNFEALTKGFVKGGKDAIRDSKLGIDTRDINLDRFEENIGAKPFYEGHKSQALNKAAKVLNKTNQILGDVMSGGDRVFYQSIYDNSLQNQMKLNKVSVPTQEMMDIAQQEALSRTWNDSNSYTKAVLQIRNAMNKLNVKGYGLGDVLVPFAKTPANLTKAIVDYSPVGLARTIIQDGNNYRNSLQNGQYNAQLQHKFADSFGKGMAGSMLWVAAYALAKAGITSGKSDDDKDVANFMRNTLGIQPYSIKIGDKSFTYDWAQPIAAPFAAMADFQSLSDSEKKDMGSIIERMTSSASNILLEQSFLSSIQDVFNSYEGPAAAIKQQIQDLPARATPTFFKQIADLIDPTSRQTYVKGDTKETMKNKVQVKIPGASKELAEQRDTLGREIKKYGGDDNKLKYAFNVFLNPANTNKGKPSKAAEEIYEVYKATGDKTIMPRQVGYSEMISGKSRNLTAKERSEWQKRAGQKVEENVKALTLNPKYNELSNEDKATVISNIVNYSFSIQKEEMFDAGVSNLYKKAYEAEQDGIPIADFYLEKMQKYIDKYR